MKFIINKNCTGKTHALIKKSLESDIPIFALYPAKAESLREKSLSYFGRVVQVVTPQSFADGYSGPILVDDMDKAFHTLLAAYVNSFDFNIIGATLTED